jgi:hypothetical protein
MARQAITPQAVLTIPGAYASYSVQANPSGLATSGVMVLIGEADQGPDFSAESDVKNTFFGPNQVASVTSKFGSGDLVNGARIASQASGDPNIQGSPTGFYLFKTNVSGKASRSAARVGFTDYGTLFDKSYGLPGNLIGTQITESPSEIAPSVTFTYIPIPVTTPGSGNSKLALRVSGTAEESVTFADKITPTTAVGATTFGSNTGLAALAGLLSTGGVHRTVLVSGTTLAVAVAGNVVTLTAAVHPFATVPSVGDTLIIPANASYGAGQDSAIKGAGSANLGLYIVNSATTTQIVATKLRDASALTVTAPVTVSATVVSADLTDIEVFSQVTIQDATGTRRFVLGAPNVSVNLTGTASGQSLTLTLASGSWAAQPQVNDLFRIHSASPAGFFNGANGGYYRVTASTVSTVTGTRLSNGAPASFSATAIGSVDDLIFLRPAVDGTGKTLELYDGASDLPIADSLYTSAGVPVTFLSTSSAPVRVISAAELGIDITNSKNTFSEDLTAGGDIGLQIGYTGTTATVTVAAKTLTTTVTGGVGQNLSITLKQYTTIGALAAYINSQPGYTCSSGNNLIAQKPLMSGSTTILDQGTYACSSQYGAQTMRIKFDAYDFWNTLAGQSQLIQLGNPSVKATSGLPEAEALAFLSGGSVGGTSNANVVAALAKAETLRANAVVPLFSDDATNDSAIDATDTSSTYTIAAINAAAKTHVLKMSTLLARRNRQAWLSFNGSFSGAQAAAASMATFRASMCFEGFIAQDASGNLVTFQPWAGAVYAAAMQMAGFYKSIMAKLINTSGVVPVDSTFDPNDDTAITLALQAGLLPARAREDGGFVWVSDQTTYAVDANFVFNSTQTVYAADLVSLTTAQRMERAFVGQSLADVSAAAAAGVFSSIMVDMKRLKLISSSDDAPAGYKNVVVNIVGDVMYVSAEIKITTTLAFIPIAFTVSQIQQTATA